MNESEGVEYGRKKSECTAEAHLLVLLPTCFFGRDGWQFPRESLLELEAGVIDKWQKVGDLLDLLEMGAVRWPQLQVSYRDGGKTRGLDLEERI